MTTVSHPEHIKQMADLGDPIAIAALEGQTITKDMYKRAWEESAKYAHKLELRVQKLEKTEAHFEAELKAAENDYERYKKLTATNAALLEALERLRLAEEDCIALRNWDQGFESFADVAELKEAQTEATEAIRKATQ